MPRNRPREVIALRWLTGWIAIVLFAALAVLAEIFGGIRWVRRLGWSAAALVGIHAAWMAWRE